MSNPAKLVVKRSFSRLTEQLIGPYRSASTGWVVDAQGRRGALPHWIRPLSSATRFIGTALTVRTRPLDNLAPYAALKFAMPGDVLVVAADADATASVMGDILIGMACNAGIVGVVTDGLVRDIAGINGVGIPTFARALTPNSPFKDGPGSVGLPIVVGGVEINSGDLVMGDEDGVVVVAQENIGMVANGLDAIAAKEAAMEQSVADGAKYPAWLDAVLDSDQVAYQD